MKQGYRGVVLLWALCFSKKKNCHILHHSQSTLWGGILCQGQGHRQTAPPIVPASLPAHCSLSPQSALLLPLQSAQYHPHFHIEAYCALPPSLTHFFTAQHIWQEHASFVACLMKIAMETKPCLKFAGMEKKTHAYSVGNIMFGAGNAYWLRDMNCHPFSNQIRAAESCQRQHTHSQVGLSTVYCAVLTHTIKMTFRFDNSCHYWTSRTASCSRVNHTIKSRRQNLQGCCERIFVTLPECHMLLSLKAAYCNTKHKLHSHAFAHIH